MSDNDGTETAIATATTRETGTPRLDPRLVVELRSIIERYPEPRSALLPMLHLVQSVEGYVTPAGIETCAALLSVSPAEVSAVATFYTMYKRRPMGEHLVGVCTNTLCAVLGGDEILTTLKQHLGVGNDETTEDGKVTLEHIECNAACDYAPVVMVNWEFFDNQTPESAREVADRLRAGEAVAPTRGAASVCSFKQMSRVLAGFDDGRAGEGVGAGPATLAGLRLAKERGWSAPEGRPARTSAQSADQLGPVMGSSESTARDGVTSSNDAPAASPDSDRGGTTDAAVDGYLESLLRDGSEGLSLFGLLSRRRRTKHS